MAWERSGGAETGGGCEPRAWWPWAERVGEERRDSIDIHLCEHLDAREVLVHMVDKPVRS